MQKDILVKKACINLNIKNVYTIYLNNLHFHGYHGLFDEEKIKQLNEVMHLITELTIETLKYSIASIRTPDTLVTEIEFIRDFLVNCDRKLYQEIRDRVIELRNSSELKPFEVVCPNCSHKHEQTLTLDQAAFFGVAS